MFLAQPPPTILARSEFTGLIAVSCTSFPWSRGSSLRIWLRFALSQSNFFIWHHRVAASCRAVVDLVFAVERSRGFSLIAQIRGQKYICF